MKIITQKYEIDNTVSSKISSFFKVYRVGSILKASNGCKSKGIAAVAIFQYIFSLVFFNRSMYMEMMSEKRLNSFAKDAVYRFIKSANINWLRFTTMLSSRIVNTTIEKLTDEERINVLIIDDTMFERNKSKNVELLSKVFDHANSKFRRGFRLLTLGWSDGNTFLPVNSCLLSSENMKNRFNEAEELDKRTAGHKRRVLAQTKATLVMLELIKEAIHYGIPAKHVLFDTWFCSPSSLTSIKGMGLDSIAMTKKTPKMHYQYNGEMLPVTAIYKQNRKRRGLSKYLLSVDVNVVKDKVSIPAKLVFVRNRNKKKDYLAIISTDITLDENEIIRIYGKRWDIEVFFKICKSYLKLTKECRSLSYDAMTAHVAVVFTRYMMLAVENRASSDKRTLGELFYLIADEMSDINWMQAFQMLMDAFLSTLADKLSLTSSQLEQFMDSFFEALPSSTKKCLGLCI